MGKAGGLFVNLGINTGQFTKGIRGARKELTGFQKIGAGLKSTFSPANLGFGAMAAGTALIGAAIGDAVTTFRDFEKAGSDLKAVLGKNALPADLENMAVQAKALGASTAFTATEVRGLQKEFAKLGFDPSQIQNMTEATLNLAAAAGVELAEAASVAGSTINAFGLNSQDAAHVTDVMALSFSKSALDMEKFSETMKNAAPIARATGVSLEVATAAAGKLADANITGSKAGTDLKRIFSELVKDGKPFAESLNDIAGQMAGASTKAEKLGIAEKLVGDRAKGALLVLTEQKDALGELSTQLLNTDEDAKKMADTMLNNLAGDVTKAGSAWEGFILSLEDGSGAISKAMRSVVSGGTAVLGWLTDVNSGGIKAESALKSLANSFLKMSAFANFQFDIPSDKIEAFERNIKSNGQALLNTKEGLNKVIAGYKTLGLSSLEAAKATKALRDEFVTTKEVMPEVADEIDKVVKSTRKFQTSVDKIEIKPIEDLVGSMKPKNPIPVMIPIKPILEIDGGIEDPMIELGNQAGTALSESLKTAAAGALMGLGEAIGTGAIEDMGGELIGAFSNLLDTFGQQLIQLGMAQVAMQIALGSLNPAVAIGAGVAVIAAAAALRNTMAGGATGFAAGGLVTGSVFANVGEGRGTTKSNPEVIAPLDKLQNMIAGSGGGMGGGEVVFRIQGQELVGILNRQKKVNKFS